MTIVENCQHKNKVYKPSGHVLLSFPSQTCLHWICEDCGYEGYDIQESTAERAILEQRKKYDSVCEKFNKNNYKTIAFKSINGYDYRYDVNHCILKTEISLQDNTIKYFIELNSEAIFVQVSKDEFDKVRANLENE